LSPPAFARGVIAYGIAIALLCLPALWNGFPLMFDDVGGYLERWPAGSLGLGRSIIYGLLLWGTRSTAFVPVIVLQALVTIFVVDRAIAVFAPASPRWMLPVAVAAIAVTSGVALYVCKPIPDAWAAPAVLALYLVAWHGPSLAKWELAALVAIVVFAGASHMATFGVLAGLSVLYVLAWLARRWLGFVPRIGTAIMAVWSGPLLLLAGNLMVAGQLTLGADGEIFLFARMVEDGAVADILAEECPRADWQLCGYRDALPAYAEAFAFDAESPLRKVGGAADPRARAEIAAIMARSLARHPLAHAVRAVELTAGQFVDVGTGGAIEPLLSGHTRAMLARYAPALIPGFDAARQQTGDIDLSAWSDWVVAPLSIAASLALPLFAVLTWRSGRRRAAMLPALLFAALVGNAAICGIVAGSNDRYQARLAWLAPLAIGLVGWNLASRRRSGPASITRPFWQAIGRVQFVQDCLRHCAGRHLHRAVSGHIITMNELPPHRPPLAGDGKVEVSSRGERDAQEPRPGAFLDGVDTDG
jgi:hypothetical protein